MNKYLHIVLSFGLFVSFGLSAKSNAGLTKMLNEFCCNTSYKYIGAEWALRFIKEKNLVNTLSSIEETVSNGGVVRVVDLRVGTIKYELKSWMGFYNSNFVNEFIKDLIQNSELNNIKWRFDNKGIGSDQNQLKRKIKEALKSTEGRAIIEGLTSSGSEADRVKSLFFDKNQITNIWTFNSSKVDTFIDTNFSSIFQY